MHKDFASSFPKANCVSKCSSSKAPKSTPWLDSPPSSSGPSSEPSSHECRVSGRGGLLRVSRRGIFFRVKQTQPESLEPNVRHRRGKRVFARIWSDVGRRVWSALLGEIVSHGLASLVDLVGTDNEWSMGGEKYVSALGGVRRPPNMSETNLKLLFSKTSVFPGILIQAFRCCLLKPVSSERLRCACRALAPQRGAGQAGGSWLGRHRRGATSSGGRLSGGTVCHLMSTLIAQPEAYRKARQPMTWLSPSESA